MRMYVYVFIKLYVVCMCLYVCVHKKHTFYQASQYYTSQMLHFLQVADKTIHQQKDYDLLYCDGLKPNPQCLGDMPMYHFVCAYVRGKEEVLNNAREKRSL